MRDGRGKTTAAQRCHLGAPWMTDVWLLLRAFPCSTWYHVLLISNGLLRPYRIRANRLVLWEGERKKCLLTLPLSNEKILFITSGMNLQIYWKQQQYTNCSLDGQVVWVYTWMKVTLVYHRGAFSSFGPVYLYTWRILWAGCHCCWGPLRFPG